MERNKIAKDSTSIEIIINWQDNEDQNMSLIKS